MKAAVIAEFLGYSGGDLVNIIIIKTLINAGYEVEIFTNNYKSYFEAYFNFEEFIPKDIKIHVISTSLPSPYSIYELTNKVRYHDNRYHIIVLNDDIPKNISRINYDLALIYIHFPHAARVTFNVLIEAKYRHNTINKIAWTIHKKMFPSLFYVKGSLPENTMLLANSTLTYHFLKILWPSTEIKVIYPPVQAKKIFKKAIRQLNSKDDQAVLIGRIMPDKKIDEVILALPYLSIIKKVKIIGPIIDFKYFNYIRKIIHKLSLEKKVEFTGLVSRNKVIEILSKSKILIHSMPMEPFGIVVVEGMAAGCIPVVKKGPNGPWIDITERGKYGYGFRDKRDLISTLKTIMNNYEKLNLKKIYSRYLQFDESLFIQNFMKVLRK